MTRTITTALAAAFALSACAEYETGRGQSPQSKHPGDIMRQQAGTDTNDQEG